MRTACQCGDFARGGIHLQHLVVARRVSDGESARGCSRVGQQLVANLQCACLAAEFLVPGERLVMFADGEGHALCRAEMRVVFWLYEGERGLTGPHGLDRIGVGIEGDDTLCGNVVAECGIAVLAGIYRGNFRIHHQALVLYDCKGVFSLVGSGSQRELLAVEEVGDGDNGRLCTQSVRRRGIGDGEGVRAIGVLRSSQFRCTGHEMTVVAVQRNVVAIGRAVVHGEGSLGRVSGVNCAQVSLVHGGFKIGLAGHLHVTDVLVHGRTRR